MKNTPVLAGSGQGLRAQLRDVEAEFPGWHVRIAESDQRIYASHTLTAPELAAEAARRTPALGDCRPLVPNAVTLTPRTPELARHEIALWEHQHSGVAA